MAVTVPENRCSTGVVATRINQRWSMPELTLPRTSTRGINVHTRTASLMLHTPMGAVTKDQRAIGKTTAFMLLYGTGFKPGGHFVDVMATGFAVGRGPLWTTPPERSRPV
jgi:hypothetical protein